MALPSSSPLHKALFCHVAGQLKYLIYTFLHGVFKQNFFFAETRRTAQMNGGDSALFYKVENGLHYSTELLGHCWGKKNTRDSSFLDITNCFRDILLHELQRICKAFP